VNNIPSAKQFDPATFQERGVATPFTTPLLGGARARPGRNQEIELLMRNPAGGRGIYVMPWNGITSICRPTLHDKVLNTRIAGLESITPATVRTVARSIAAEGLAGEPAMEAARAAIETSGRDRLVTNYQLLTALIRQINVVPDLPSEALGSDTAELNARARLAIARLASHLRQPATWAVGALDAIAGVMAGTGMASSGEVGRVPRLIALLRRTREDIAEWSLTLQRENQVSCARMICSAADLTLSLAATELSKVRVLTDDMVGLLRSWAAEPDLVVRLAARPEWLLDGWEQICLIWNYALDEPSRSVALAEIADHVPVLPKEVNDWTGHESDLNKQSLTYRPIRLNADWRTGVNVFDLIARNEQFLATEP